MKNVIGGLKALCTMTNTLYDGTIETSTIDVPNNSEAQAWCDSQLNAEWEPSKACTYKCAGGEVS